MDIAALTALKHLSKKISEEEGDPHSISQVQESNSVFSDVNGNMQGFTQENEQGNKHPFLHLAILVYLLLVSENGKLMSKISHQEKQEAEAGGKPHIEELTEIDVPEENIHEQIVNDDGDETVAKVKRDVSKLNFVMLMYNTWQCTLESPVPLIVNHCGYKPQFFQNHQLFNCNDQSACAARVALQTGC